MSLLRRQRAAALPPVASGPARVVELACRAPSVHNTQPWSWRVLGTALELHADRRRQLQAADPRGRDLLISCGAALHHAEVAARGLGWEPTTTRFVGSGPTELLARVALVPAAPTAEHVTDLASLVKRRTDRRRFTSWPVQEEQLQWLCAAAAAHGVAAVPVTEVIERLRVEHLLSRARRTQAADARITEEHRRWLDHSGTDGVQAALVPTPDGLPSNRRHRFAHGRLGETRPDLEDNDGLIVICTDSDRPDDAVAWFAVGEALSALWLTAVGRGLSVVPLTQVIEVQETRTELELSPLGGLAMPQLLVRVGWAPIGRHDLPHTPRRPLSDVLI